VKISDFPSRITLKMAPISFYVWISHEVARLVEVSDDMAFDFVLAPRSQSEINKGIADAQEGFREFVRHGVQSL
jgi:hypothetical protein